MGVSTSSGNSEEQVKVEINEDLRDSDTLQGLKMNMCTTHTDIYGPQRK